MQWAGVNQFDACPFTNKSTNIPALTSHRLSAPSSVSMDNLKKADLFNYKFQFLHISIKNKYAPRDIYEEIIP